MGIGNEIISKYKDWAVVECIQRTAAEQVGRGILESITEQSGKGKVKAGPSGSEGVRRLSCIPLGYTDGRQGEQP